MSCRVGDLYADENIPVRDIGLYENQLDKQTLITMVDYAIQATECHIPQDIRLVTSNLVDKQTVCCGSQWVWIGSLYIMFILSSAVN